MLYTVMPANLIEFIKDLVKIVKFDILNSEWTTQYVFTFDYDQYEKLEG